MALSPTNLSIPRTGDPHRMHVARPKSAKGRTRTNPQGISHNVETFSNNVPAPSPRVSTSRSGSRINQEEIPQLLHQIPSRPPSSSLNRYRVLPSIRMSGCSDKKDEEELAQQTSAMRLTAGSQERQMKALYRDQGQSLDQSREASQRHDKSLDNPSSLVTLNLQEPSDQEPRLLLAIRTHSGQRFERYFRPTDTLYTVLAVAEEKTGVSCKDCSVETMEVPRRSYQVLSWTLQQCDIHNKSVLCIHQVEMD
ncbi:hypothetical protein GDO86_018805 [Hymenochirus boettgeri]|uniref:UBX domain-containing protein n=1 Tax=Hymenochirus boettgeri TaxID=247094 RepID=A0A8T2IFI1_9PIPI|nr:hypothetical protein GDO86_018805 [Hymenochirus boettgeri]